MKPYIDVIHEDDDILVCRNPAGLAVQSAKAGQQDMVSLLKNYRAGRQEPPEIYLVHRLDQPVEGIMVFAKNKKAAASLSKQMQQKRVDKYYNAVVEGVFNAPEGRLEDYLLRDGRSNTSRVVPADTPGAKRAVLHYRVLKVCNGAAELALTDDNRTVSLVEILLETGRHHQIRVQLAHAGHPLAGDKKYNPNCQTGYLPIGLCSVSLAFSHPAIGKRMKFSIVPKGPAFQNFS